MSMQASAYGRLGGAPRAIETRSGKPMTVATLAVSICSTAWEPCCRFAICASSTRPASWRARYSWPRKGPTSHSFIYRRGGRGHGPLLQDGRVRWMRG